MPSSNRLNFRYRINYRNSIKPFSYPASACLQTECVFLTCSIPCKLRVHWNSSRRYTKFFVLLDRASQIPYTLLRTRTQCQVLSLMLFGKMVSSEGLYRLKVIIFAIAILEWHILFTHLALHLVVSCILRSKVSPRVNRASCGPNASGSNFVTFFFGLAKVYKKSFLTSFSATDFIKQFIRCFPEYLATFAHFSASSVESKPMLWRIDYGRRIPHSVF